VGLHLVTELSALRVGDRIDVEGTPLNVIEVVYPFVPSTGRGLYRVQKPSVGMTYALKVFDLTAGNDGAAIAREVVAINRTLAHPEHFAKAHAFEVRGRWGLVLLDWMSGTPLSRCCEHAPRGPSELRQRREVFAEICYTVSLIHKQRLVHRDLKPDNVLLRNPKDARAGVAIIDFGLTNERRQRLEGTLGYHAPEQSRSRELNLGAAADVFALGQICHFMLTGQSTSIDTNDVVTDWDPASFAQMEQNPRIPKGFASLLNAALRFKPEQRPRAIDLASAARRIRDEQPATSA
jgi:serine/threonine protein kinase